MAICFSCIHTPPSYRNLTLGKPLCLWNAVLTFPDIGNSLRLDNDSRCIWGLADCSENRYQVWVIDSLHIPRLQWTQTIGLGYGSFIGQETEWKSVMVSLGLFYECIFGTGFLQAWR